MKSRVVASLLVFGIPVGAWAAGCGGDEETPWVGVGPGSPDATTAIPPGATPDATPSLDASSRADADADASAAPPGVHIAAGSSTTCALISGVLKCWGVNNYGQLGTGTVDLSGPHPAPSSVPLPSALDIAVDSHACATTNNGLYCWGDNRSGQAGQPAIGNTDGGCASPDCVKSPAVVALGPVKQVSAGRFSTCAVLSNGTVACWGQNFWVSDGGLGHEAHLIDGLSDIVEVAVGFRFACARKIDGSIWCWGENSVGQLGRRTTDAGSGTDNAVHRIPAPIPGLSGAKHLGVYSYAACAVLADDTVACWGRNGANNVVLHGNLGHDPSTDALCQNGWPCRPEPTVVQGLTGAKQVAPGYGYTCALRQNGTVACWGDGQQGVLGIDVSRFDASVNGKVVYAPVDIGNLTGIVEIAAGERHTCAINGQNQAWCWGDDFYGELGTAIDGSSSADTFSHVPLPVSGL